MHTRERRSFHRCKTLKMDTNFQNLNKPDTNVEENHQDEITILPIITPPLSTASISVSLSTIFPTHLLLPPKPSPPPNKLKIPSQLSSLSHLYLSSSPLKQFFKSTTLSSSPLQTTLPHTPHDSSDPTNPIATRRSSIVWFRNDLRIHDNECLNLANNDSISVLPVYCFDPRDYGKSSSGFDKTGPYHAAFFIKSVSNLRRNLQCRGSDLVVRIGKPEIVLVELAKAIGADAIYAHSEVSRIEVRAEEKIEEAMKEEGVEVKYIWGSTLYHIDDLPFKLEEMPSNYGGFREKVKGLEIRKSIESLDQLKGLPASGDVEFGDIPTLLDLGLNPNATLSQEGKHSLNASLVGGETEALHRLSEFVAEFWSQPNNDNKDGSMYGANFSSKISPWLTVGCLSPRFMLDELKKSAIRTTLATSTWNGGTGPSGNGMSWLMFELSWRDFFGFIAKKYNTTKKMLDGAPATACTGALLQEL